MKSILKIAISGAFILLLSLAYWVVTHQSRTFSSQTDMELADFMAKVKAGEVQDAAIEGKLLRGHLKSSPNDLFETTLPNDHEAVEAAIISARVPLTIKEEQTIFWKNLLPNAISLVFVIGMVILVIPPFWVIFRKAGFQPTLSILVLVPLVNLVVLYAMAFSKWKTDPHSIA
jgi:ATP-dependent Zn protease